MNDVIGSSKARTRLPELLRQVKSGRRFTLTNRGKAIADLVPSTAAPKKDRVEAATRLREFMLADPIRGVEIKRLIEERRA